MSVPFWRGYHFPVKKGFDQNVTEMRGLKEELSAPQRTLSPFPFRWHTTPAPSIQKKKSFSFFLSVLAVVFKHMAACVLYNLG